MAEEAAGQNEDQLPLGWTVVLRRQPTRITDEHPQGYTGAFELICCECGDNPDLGYRHVPTEIQRIRGPYPIEAGIAAYQQHVRRHNRRQARPGETTPATASTEGHKHGHRHP